MAKCYGLHDLQKGSYVVDPVSGEISQRVICNDKPLCHTFSAGETLSAVKAVYSSGANEVSLADNATKPEACVIGITKHAANLGDDVEVATLGVLQDSSFTFNSGDTIYLDSNGNLTTTAPTTGVLTVIGKGLGNNQLLISIEEPIVL